MLILGHAGITLGAAVVLDRVLAKRRLLRTRKDTAEEGRNSHLLSQTSPARNCSASGRVSRFISLGEHIDVRLLLLGALLPDIIDKVVGQVVFPDTFSNGRIFCHTLLLLMLITLAGLFLYRKHRKTWLLVLSFGAFTHLILDRMWLEPRTLLWPLYGFAFEKVDLTQWWQDILHALYTNPSVYVPELMGAVILIWFAWVLLRNRTLYRFIKSGQTS